MSDAALNEWSRSDNGEIRIEAQIQFVTSPMSKLFYLFPFQQFRHYAINDNCVC